MVHLYFNIDSELSTLDKYPDIIENMRNALAEVMGEYNPILKINMNVPHHPSYDEETKRVMTKLSNYFTAVQAVQGNGYNKVEESKERENLINHCFYHQFLGEHGTKPHIEIGGLNGNMSIAIRSMTHITDEQHKAIDNKMCGILQPYVKVDENGKYI